MKILIAPDKFKGSISADRICQVLSDAFVLSSPQLIVTECPLADGGDGTLEVLQASLMLDKKTVKTVDPIHRPIEADYLYDDHSAYIELASASGITLLTEEERNPLLTSTYGTGLMIKDAVDNGIHKIHLFLGGSATNDGGLGILQALGYQLLDDDNKPLKANGNTLNSLSRIIPPLGHTSMLDLTIYSDVDNPAVGSNGAAHTFAAQKGANKSIIDTLESGMYHLCTIIESQAGTKMHMVEGAGAAGGVAVSLSGMLNAKINSGIRYVSHILSLEKQIKEADLIITGEGKIDRQSLHGKVISHVALLCTKHHKSLIAIVGKNDLSVSDASHLGVDKVYSLSSVASNQMDAIQNPEKYLIQIAHQITNQVITPS